MAMPYIFPIFNVVCCISPSSFVYYLDGGSPDILRLRSERPVSAGQYLHPPLAEWKVFEPFAVAPVITPLQITATFICVS
jgi:hypothetical protein